MTDVALSEVIADARPGFACGENDPSGVVQIRMNNVNDGVLVLDSLRRVPRTALEDLERFRVSPGDVLFNATNSPELVGKSALFKGYDEPVVYSNHFIRLRPVADRLESRYLSRWLHTLWQRGDFSRMCKQWVNQASVPSERLLSLRVPLPTLAEQRRVCDILDKADELRAKRRAALVELNALALSVFFDLFGDPDLNPHGWPVRALGELIAAGPQNGLYKPATDYGSGTPILRIDNFYDGAVTDFSALKRVRISDGERALYGLHEGDIVINRVNSREYLGKSALIPALGEPTVFESNMMRFEVDRRWIDPGYLIHLLQTPRARRHILKSAKDAVNQSSINQQDVKALAVPVPPLSRQQEFDRRVLLTRQCCVSQEVSLQELNALFSSLQSAAFSGDL